MLHSKLLLLFFVLNLVGSAQQEVASFLSVQPLGKAFASLFKKAVCTEVNPDKATENYRANLERQEGKLKTRLWKKDNLLASQLFDGIKNNKALKCSRNTSGKFPPGCRYRKMEWKTETIQDNPAV